MRSAMPLSRWPRLIETDDQRGAPPMTKYVVLYHAPESVAERFARATPEEAQLGVQAWIDWADRLGPALIDAGSPLANPVTLTRAGRSDEKSTVIGMSIVQADSMEAALALVEDHHHLHW